MNRSLLMLVLLFVSAAQGNPQWYWQHPLPQGNTLQDIVALSPTTAVAVGWAGTVLKTTNAGAQWRFTSVGDSAYLMDAAFFDSFNGLAVGFSSLGVLYQTTDGGEHWTLTLATPGVALAGIAFASDSVAVAVGGAGTVMRSSDGGSSWEPRRANTTKALNAVTFWSESDGIAVGSSGTMLRTTDGGLSWTPVTIPTTESLYCAEMGSPSTCIVAGGSTTGLIVRTTNGGATWSVKSGIPSRSLVSVSWFDSTTCLVTAKQDIALRSTDKGEHWDTVRTLSNANRCAVLPTGSAIAVGWNGLLASSTDSGVSWSQSLDSFWSYDLLSVCFVDSLSGWAVGGVNSYVGPTVLLGTTNGGSSWSTHKSGSEAPLSRVFFLDRNIGWVVGGYSDSTIRKTTNGGATWSSQRTPHSVELSALTFVDGFNGWAAGSGGTIIHSTNGGTAWLAQTSGSTTTLTSVFFIDPNKGWAVGWGGTMFRTSNGGELWEPSTVPTSASLYDIAFINPIRGVAVGDDGTILNTTDGGATWLVRTVAPKGHYLRSVSFEDSCNVWACGESGWIVRSTDGGLSWSRTSGATHQNLYSVHARSGGLVWAVGSRGTIISTRPSVPVIDAVGEPIALLQPIPSGVELNQNFPNPFNGISDIGFRISELAWVKLQVFDLLGREVAVVVNQEMAAGTYRVQFNAGNLASGVYLYRLTAGGQTATRRMLLIR